MAEYLYQTRLAKWILEKRRRTRVNHILSEIDVWPRMNILDVGCGPNGRSFESYALEDCTITGIDILSPQDVKMEHPRFRYFQQDARDLSRFPSKSFDLAISIGMMEHICDRSVLEQIADEMIRVSRQWIIGVPWRYCCLEPHFKFPFFQFLPGSWQLALTRRLNLHNLGSTVQDDASWIKNHYQWLPGREWKSIFRADKARVSLLAGDLLVIGSDQRCPHGNLVNCPEAPCCNAAQSEQSSDRAKGKEKVLVAVPKRSRKDDLLYEDVG